MKPAHQGRRSEHAGYKTIPYKKICSALFDRFQETCDAEVVATADWLAIKLFRLPSEVCDSIRDQKADIEALMLRLGITASIRAARVVMTEAE